MHTTVRAIARSTGSRGTCLLVKSLGMKMMFGTGQKLGGGGGGGARPTYTFKIWGAMVVNGQWSVLLLIT